MLTSSTLKEEKDISITVSEELKILNRLGVVFDKTEHETENIEKFALMYDDKLQAYFDTRRDAHQAAKLVLHNRKIYLVQKVTETPDF